LVFELTAHRPMLHRQYCAMESPILKNQQVFPQTASLPLPQHSQVARLLRDESLAAAACNSPRESIVVACRIIFEQASWTLRPIEDCN
jgi:hypothetical protein